jgi:hypothetical protein
MGKGTASLQRLEEVASYAQQHGYKEAAEFFGLSYHVVRNYVSYHRKKANPVVGKYQFDERKDVTELTGQIASRNTDRVKVLEEFLELCKVDLSVWEVERYVLNAWDVTMKNPMATKESELGKAFTNYQIKVWLRKPTILFDHQKFLTELIEDVKKFSPFTIPIRAAQTGMMLEIPIVDPHWGKLAWAPETGGENYDYKIATERFNQSFDYHLSNALQFTRPEQIVIVLNGDIFNSDNAYPFPHTTRGTPQEDDLRWQKGFRMVRQVISAKVDEASQHAPVVIVPIQGNHDFQKMFYLTEVLAVKYHNNPNVTVDASPRTRKYLKWGDVLLGFAHGNHKDEGEKRLPHIMQQEQREAWGSTKFAEWHLADIHHNKAVSFISMEDRQGLVMRYLWSFKELDSYESQKGYYSQKGSTSFIFSKTTGLNAQFHFSV